MINNQQMVANIIEGIDIPPRQLPDRIRAGLHLFVKDTKP